MNNNGHSDTTEHHSTDNNHAAATEHEIEQQIEGQFEGITFPGEVIKKLTSADFAIDSEDLIPLKSILNCTLILFYNNNQESKSLIKLWYAVGVRTAGGPLLAAVNLSNESALAAAFMKLKGNPDHPLNKLAYNSLPAIMLYRNRWPIKFYNGARSAKPLADYIMTFAAQDVLREEDRRRGIRIDLDLSMKGDELYDTDIKSIDTAKDFGVASPYSLLDPEYAASINKEKELIKEKTTITTNNNNLGIESANNRVETSANSPSANNGRSANRNNNTNRVTNNINKPATASTGRSSANPSANNGRPANRNRNTNTNRVTTNSNNPATTATTNTGRSSRTNQ